METITALSTYVQDVLSKEDGTGETRLAGPAYFIEQAFRMGACPHTLIVGKEMRVEIEIRGGKERGRVSGASFSQPLPPVSTPNLLVSTLWREWETSQLANYSGRVFLDVQGFVRNSAAGFGAKQEWREARELASRLFCLKATTLELTYLPPEVVVEQKNKRCLIVTSGGKGSEVFYQGNYYKFPVELLTSLSDTLGAGDTYFANFIMEFLKSGNPEQAGAVATARVTKFLSNKVRRSS